LPRRHRLGLISQLQFCENVASVNSDGHCT